ncbi:DEAD/DEAH box helicase family protein [Clostridium baratii]|uniref:DEAD/DEAH box helicase family protein n=1 Tax=Clostridium baratii TaxID=1561 RepID=UPI0030CB57CB
MKQLTVNEIIKNEGIMLHRNKINIVVAPAGSGKTYYIFNTLLNPTEKSIYLCDTSNLKEAILRDKDYFDMTQSRKDIKLIHGFHNDKYNCTVMTYAEYFYHYNDLRYANVKTIICDEIHNLFKYKDNFDDEEHRNYSIVIDILKHKSKCGTSIVGFTATHDRLKREMNCLLPKNDDTITTAFNSDWNIINLSNHKDIKKLKENFVSVFGDIRQVNSWFARTNLFKFGKKCLIYTDRITTAINTENYINKMFNLNAISLWSINNNDYPMNEKQLKVRSSILNNGVIPNDYNVLIINNSYQTGINIKDEDIEIVIINTTNKDTQIQARSRVRKDIELLMYKVPRSQSSTIPVITVPNEYLDRKLTKSEKKELIKLFNIKDSNNRFIAWTSFKAMLLYNSYQVIDSTIRINKIRTRVSEIKDNLVI